MNYFVFKSCLLTGALADVLGGATSLPWDDALHPRFDGAGAANFGMGYNISSLAEIGHHALAAGAGANVDVMPCKGGPDCCVTASESIGQWQAM